MGGGGHLDCIQKMEGACGCWCSLCHEGGFGEGGLWAAGSVEAAAAALLRALGSAPCVWVNRRCHQLGRVLEYIWWEGPAAKYLIGVLWSTCGAHMPHASMGCLAAMASGMHPY